VLLERQQQSTHDEYVKQFRVRLHRLSRARERRIRTRLVTRPIIFYKCFTAIVCIRNMSVARATILS